jgi:hypothetical protein
MPYYEVAKLVTVTKTNMIGEVKSRCVVRMLSKSLRALWKAPGGPGNIWKNLAALVKATGVSPRFGCSFRSDFDFADMLNEPIPTYGCSWLQCDSVHLHLDTDRARRYSETAIGE